MKIKIALFLLCSFCEIDSIHFLMEAYDLSVKNAVLFYDPNQITSWSVMLSVIFIPKAIESILSLQLFRYCSFATAILVHNAGSLGPQGQPVRDSHDITEMQNYFSVNLVSFSPPFYLIEGSSNPCFLSR